MTGHLDYEKMVEQALRGMVRQILLEINESGLPGEHHLYITFYTDFPGVNLADYIREKYPEEMTIVLQHRFWGLQVEENKFSVTLSFNGVNEELIIPFEAISGFADPSVNFGLRFDIQDDLEDEEILFTEDPIEDQYDLEDDLEASEDKPKKKSGAAKVVSLDAFRKKTPSKT